MVGIYINGNGKNQKIIDLMLGENTYKRLKLSKTTAKDWEHKIKRYNDFYNDGIATAQLKSAAVNKYGSVGTIELAVATYLEEDMDMFLEKVGRILNTQRVAY